MSESPPCGDFRLQVGKRRETIHVQYPTPLRFGGQQNQLSRPQLPFAAGEPKLLNKVRAVA